MPKMLANSRTVSMAEIGSCELEESFVWDKSRGLLHQAPGDRLLGCTQ